MSFSAHDISVQGQFSNGYFGVVMNFGRYQSKSKGSLEVKRSIWEVEK